MQREVLGAESGRGPSQRGRCRVVGARRAADAEIDAPGCSASSIANCSATTRGGWFGSMTPPEPTRMRSVLAARCAISTAGLVLATVRMLWCSATQKRVSPSASARRASASSRRARRRSSCPRSRSRGRARTAVAESPGHGTFGRDGCLPCLSGHRRELGYRTCDGGAIVNVTSIAGTQGGHDGRATAALRDVVGRARDRRGSRTHERP